MRVCLIGVAGGVVDEGMKNITAHLSTGLSGHHEVLLLNTFDCYTPDFWRQLWKFEPDVVHFVTGTSIKSFALLDCVSRAVRNKRVKTVMSTPLLKLTDNMMPAVRFMRPDLAIVQSARLQSYFDRCGIKVAKMAISGVDVDRFRPDQDKRAATRERFGFGPDDFVITHIGHLRPSRNFETLSRIKEQDQALRVVAVGSTSTLQDQRICDELAGSGCMVLRDYIPDIENIYRMSDCYLFPTVRQYSAVEMPVTVLEAMGCNTPVISTRYGVLPEMLDARPGLWYADGIEGIMGSIADLRAMAGGFDLRSRVMGYSWPSIIGAVEDVYEGLLNH